ncbi:MAG: limonene-1,2-epoxide hydrolase family protein [Acidimicrobiia bacterium]
MSAESVVREFCAGAGKRDLELLRGLLADDVLYLNVGVNRSEGIEATLANVAGQWAAFSERYDYELVNIAVNGNVVLTERIDRVQPAGGAPVAPVPVMGRFEVVNERITKWIDYFDSALVPKLFAGESGDLLP